jgi:hypothetical protein
MSNNPINLTVRFLLELAGLAAMGVWGWTQHEGILRFVWTIGLPVAAAVMWGTFRIEGEPGHASVAVHGIVRLALEAAYFGAAVWLLALAGHPTIATALGVVVVVHYATSYDRVLRMVRNEKPVPVQWGKPRE